MDSSVNEDKSNIMKQAHKFFNNEEWDKALVEYKKILALEPDDMNTHQILGDIYFQKNHFQLAHESYKKAADGFLSSGQAGKALLVYKHIAKLDASKLAAESRTQVNFAQGYVKIDEALTEDQLKTAVEIMGKILKFRPEDSMVRAQLKELDGKINKIVTSVQQYQTLGDIFLNNNLFEKAREMFQKILNIDPSNISARLGLVQVYLKKGSESEAKKEYLSLAEESFAKGNFDQAFELAQKAIELKSVEARYITGLVYFKRQKYEEAIIEFEILLRIKVNHLNALLYLGKSFDILGRMEKAEETFQKALKMEKDNPDVQEAWIEFCVRQKDDETAVPELTVMLDRAIIENNPERIAKFAKLMIRLKPNLIPPHAKLIEALQTLGDFHGAADIYCKLARIHKQQNHASLAIECLEKALILDPANADTLEKAIADMRGTGTRDNLLPRSKSSNEKLMILENSDFDEIFPQFQDPAPSNPASLKAFEPQITMANNLVQQGFLKPAIEIYRQILDTNPHLEDVRNKLKEVNDLFLKKFTE